MDSTNMFMLSLLLYVFAFVERPCAVSGVSLSGVYGSRKVQSGKFLVEPEGPVREVSRGAGRSGGFLVKPEGPVR